MAKNETKIEKQAEQIMSPELEAMKAQIEQMIANAKAEAEKIIANAKEQAKAVADGKPVMSEEAKKAEDYWNEDVEIQLFKDNGKYKDDVYVAVNGVNCLIQRGKPVKVKRKFAETLRRSLEQDNETADMIRELESDYEKRSKELN
jgi:hypothetical protein